MFCGRKGMEIVNAPPCGQDIQRYYFQADQTSSLLTIFSHSELQLLSASAFRITHPEVSNSNQTLHGLHHGRVSSKKKVFILSPQSGQSNAFNAARSC
jgi:hypothetical protein